MPHDLWRYSKKTNKTLTAYIHHFKTAVKQCAFDNDTVAICIFLKGLKNAPIIASKYITRTPILWLRSSALLRSSAQHSNWQLHYLLPQSVWCLVMISVLSVDWQVILAATALMPSAMAVINLAILPPVDSSIRNTMPPWKNSFKVSIHTQLEGWITLLLWYHI